jgi:RimJ/RimL family protein N-acetyltransferase
MSYETNDWNQPLGRVVPHWKAPPVPGRAVMTGRFCRLEPLDARRHAGSLHAANVSKPGRGNWTYLAYGPFEREEDYRTWIERDCGGSDPQFYAIVDLAAGEARGVASYLRIAPESGSIEVGHLNFSPLLQRTPAATEAIYVMMARVFQLGYRRCEWKCDVLNAPSRAAALRLGFSFEGIFRQATVVKGRSRDTAWYAVIDSDWPALAAAHREWLSPSNFDEKGRQRTRLSALTAGLLNRNIVEHRPVA